MSKHIIKRKVANRGFFKHSTGLRDKVALVEQGEKGAALPSFRSGDTVKVSVRIKEGDKERVQVYEGVVIRIKNDAGNRTFTVRKISHGVGVERIFSTFSPRIAGLEVVQSGRTRRAKLYFLRDREGRAARLERETDQ